jgi:hypothetical protein
MLLPYWFGTRLLAACTISTPSQKDALPLHCTLPALPFPAFYFAACLSLNIIVSSRPLAGVPVDI